MKKNREANTWVTGTGVISAFADGTEGTGRLFRSGNKEAYPVPAPAGKDISTTLKIPVFEVRSFSGSSKIPRSIALLERVVEEALANAGLFPNLLNGKRIGVCIGTTIACQLNDIPFYQAVKEGIPVSSDAVRRYLDNNPAEYLKRKYALTGPALTVSTACASGTDAIGLASLWIEAGLCDLVIAGGTDEMNRVPIAGFHALGVASTRLCRPFDKERDGLNLGEGAAAVILESKKSCQKRNIKSVFALASYASSADAYHITSPHPDGIGLERAVRLALTKAELSSNDIDFINAHGTGTPINDITEGRVLCNVFGNNLRYLSTKALTGHTLGAAGAIEFVFTLLMLRDGIIPPSRGFREKPEELPSAPLTQSVRVRKNAALSTSLAFGGCNSALIIRRED